MADSLALSTDFIYTPNISGFSLIRTYDKWFSIDWSVLPANLKISLYPLVKNAAQLGSKQ